MDSIDSRGHLSNNSRFHLLKLTV